MAQHECGTVLVLEEFPRLDMNDAKSVKNGTFPSAKYLMVKLIVDTCSGKKLPRLLEPPLATRAARRQTALTGSRSSTRLALPSRKVAPSREWRNLVSTIQNEEMTMNMQYLGSVSKETKGTRFPAGESLVQPNNHSA